MVGKIVAIRGIYHFTLVPVLFRVLRAMPRLTELNLLFGGPGHIGVVASFQSYMGFSSEPLQVNTVTSLSIQVAGPQGFNTTCLLEAFPKLENVAIDVNASSLASSPKLIKDLKAANETTALKYVLLRQRGTSDVTGPWPTRYETAGTITKVGWCSNVVKSMEPSPFPS